MLLVVHVQIYIYTNCSTYIINMKYKILLIDQILFWQHAKIVNRINYTIYILIEYNNLYHDEQTIILILLHNKL